MRLVLFLLWRPSPTRRLHRILFLKLPLSSPSMDELMHSSTDVPSSHARALSRDHHQERRVITHPYVVPCKITYRYCVHTQYVFLRTGQIEQSGRGSGLPDTMVACRTVAAPGTSRCIPVCGPCMRSLVVAAGSTAATGSHSRFPPFQLASLAHLLFSAPFRTLYRQRALGMRNSPRNSASPVRL
jgi:hypothetical protein